MTRVQAMWMACVLAIVTSACAEQPDPVQESTVMAAETAGDPDPATYDVPTINEYNYEPTMDGVFNQYAETVPSLTPEQDMSMRCWWENAAGGYGSPGPGNKWHCSGITGIWVRYSIHCRWDYGAPTITCYALHIYG